MSNSDNINYKSESRLHEFILFVLFVSSFENSLLFFFFSVFQLFDVFNPDVHVRDYRCSHCFTPSLNRPEQRKSSLPED